MSSKVKILDFGGVPIDLSILAAISQPTRAAILQEIAKTEDKTLKIAKLRELLPSIKERNMWQSCNALTKAGILEALGGGKYKFRVEIMNSLAETFQKCSNFLQKTTPS